MRLLICGSRNWDDYRAILTALREIQKHATIDVVIEGEARGADTLARVAAEHLDIRVVRAPAQWPIHGLAAGPIRNQFMLDEGRPTHALAFSSMWWMGGTGDMVKRLETADVPVAKFRSMDDVNAWVRGEVGSIGTALWAAAPAGASGSPSECHP